MNVSRKQVHELEGMPAVPRRGRRRAGMGILVFMAGMAVTLLAISSAIRYRSARQLRGAMSRSSVNRVLQSIGSSALEETACRLWYRRSADCASIPDSLEPATTRGLLTRMKVPYEVTVGQVQIRKVKEGQENPENHATDLIYEFRVRVGAGRSSFFGHAIERDVVRWHMGRRVRVHLGLNGTGAIFEQWVLGPEPIAEWTEGGT